MFIKIKCYSVAQLYGYTHFQIRMKVKTILLILRPYFKGKIKPTTFISLQPTTLQTSTSTKRLTTTVEPTTNPAAYTKPTTQTLHTITKPSGATVPDVPSSPGSTASPIVTGTTSVINAEFGLQVNLPAAIGVPVGILLLIVLGTVVYCIIRRRRRYQIEKGRLVNTENASEIGDTSSVESHDMAKTSWTKM